MKEETSNYYSSNKLELAFPKIIVEDNDEGEVITKGRTGELLSLFSTSMDEVTEWFKSYQVESIEMWISGVIEAGGITKLVVSAKGEGGMKVVLKPKHIQQGVTDSTL
jgi:hypothetical protein